MANKKKRKTESGVFGIYRVLRWILIPLVLTMMGVSTFMLIKLAVEYKQGDDAYRSVSDRFVSTASAPKPRQTATADPQTEDATPQPEPIDGTGTPEPETTPQPDDARYAPIEVDFDRLRQMNGECIGWIYIPDTVINYPIMQASNNSKYLTILPDGTENKAGSIFMDARNSADLTDLNTVIYGHMMQDGTMFAALSRFKDRDFLNSHRTAYLLTPEQNYEFTFFACMTVSAIGDTYEMYEDSDSLHAYLRDTLKREKMSDAIDPDEVDRVVVLSTCSGNYGTRTVLLGTLDAIG